MIEGEIRDVNEGRMKCFDSLDSRENTVAILGDRRWPKTAKQDRDEMSSKRLLCEVWKKRN